MSQDKIQFLKQQVPLQARTWIDTKFHHQGRSKKSDKFDGGVDCLGLVVGVADELMLTDENFIPIVAYDQTNYSRLGTGKALIEVLDKHLVQIDEIEPGCILLFEIMSRPQHVGIVGVRDGRFSLIHCYQGSDKVVEHELTDKWKQRILKIYRFK